jgi:predicted DsbA family dithiol-disulfide isomerase
MQGGTGNKVLAPALLRKLLHVRNLGGSMIHLTYYLDVMSSWCFYVEPNLDRLRERYADRLTCDWRIALVTEAGSQGWNHDQIAWFYKRSGAVTGVQLNPAWNRGPHTTLQPNLAAEAARELGCGDDRVRRALAHAALIEGLPIYHKREAVRVAAAAGGLDQAKLIKLMDEPRIEERIRESGEEFASYRIDQRPGFVIRSDIGDRVVYSGVWRLEPLDAAIGALIKDEDEYARFAAANEPLPAPT